MALARYEHILVSAVASLPDSSSASRIYEASVRLLLRSAAALTNVLQNRTLSTVLATFLMTWLALVGPILVVYGLDNVPFPALETLGADLLTYEALIALLIPVGVIVALITQSRLGALIATGFTGTMIALLFALTGAPDLALLHMFVVVLSIILLLQTFSLFRSRFAAQMTGSIQIRNGMIAGSLGLLVAGLTFAFASMDNLFIRTSSFYIAESVPQEG
jgi:multisubunit Na+/H+ antiporter MnhB subunit